MLLGTHTSGKGTDQLMIAEVMLPKTATETAGKDITELYDEERQGMSIPLLTMCLLCRVIRLTFRTRIIHEFQTTNQGSSHNQPRWGNQQSSIYAPEHRFISYEGY